MDTENTDFTFEHPAIMSTPWFMLTILGIYWVVINYIGPNYMKSRKPYELKTLIILHNIVQVLSCIYVVHEIIHISENTIYYFWKCSALDKTYQRMSRHYQLGYFLFWLKISELLETIIFVLRKKQNQVTKLHVFHHIATVTLIYMLINHNNKNGCDALFPIFLNSFVHIIMYSYYLIAATADKKIVRALQPIKKSITVMQMVQFGFILVHAALTMKNCGVPRIIFQYYTFVIILMFYGFFDFYKSSYKKKSQNTQKAEKAQKKVNN